MNILNKGNFPRTLLANDGRGSGEKTVGDDNSLTISGDRSWKSDIQSPDQINTLKFIKTESGGLVSHLLINYKDEKQAHVPIANLVRRVKAFMEKGQRYRSSVINYKQAQRLQKVLIEKGITNENLELIVPESSRTTDIINAHSSETQVDGSSTIADEKPKIELTLLTEDDKDGIKQIFIDCLDAQKAGGEKTSQQRNFAIKKLLPHLRASLNNANLAFGESRDALLSLDNKKQDKKDLDDIRAALSKVISSNAQKRTKTTKTSLDKTLLTKVETASEDLVYACFNHAFSQITRQLRKDLSNNRKEKADTKVINDQLDLFINMTTLLSDFNQAAE